MEELPKINVIYEDNHLLVVEKIINVPVQKDDSNDIDMISILKEYRKRHENKAGDAYIGLVHRLDRPVGGIMVFAKTSKAASRLSEQVRNNEFKKIYYAVLEGSVPDNGHFEDYMAKDNKANKSYITTKDKGKLAILDYEVISRKNNLSLVKINLLTGRSHQIRVQFSSRGYPLIGDVKYNKNAKPGTNIALFSKSISFKHPTTKENLNFELDLPDRYPFNTF